MTEIVLVGKRKRTLTGKMLEVQELINQGKKNKEIAELRGTSEAAVVRIKTRINRRMKIKGLYEDLHYNR